MKKRIQSFRILYNTFICLCLLLGICSVSCAQTIQLKSGQTLEGRIINRTEQYVEIDIGVGMPLTFYFDEIEKIIEEPSATGRRQRPLGREKRSAEKHKEKSFLWKVQSEDTKAIVYLLGSIHIGKKDMYPLRDVIEQAFEKASFLVVEVDMEKGANRYMQQMMVERGTYPKGESLKGNLSKETFIKLVKYLRRYGLSSHEFSQFKPWLVGLTLLQLQVTRLGFDPKYGIDRYFEKKARGAKEILDLESAEHQIDLFNHIEDQEKFLEYSMASLEETEQALDQMMIAWDKGDAQAMEQLLIDDILEENPDLDSIYRSIFYDRNINMASQIKEYLKADDIYFVVVGAGHLIGGQGIPALLEKEGYRVQQL